MRRVSNKFSFYAGILLIITSILFNKKFIEIVLVTDSKIDSNFFISAIYTFQLSTIILGVYLLFKQPAIRILSKSDFTLLLSSLVGLFLVLELATWLWLHYLTTDHQYRKYVLFTNVKPTDQPWTRHHYLNYFPTPNYKRGLTYHNSLGFRNREFPPTKPDDTYRIVALGGSSTYTTAVEDNEKTFTAQLEKTLHNKFNNKNVEVINAGVPGYNSWESLINLEFRVLDLDPDLVIVYHGTNDVHTRLVLPESYRGDNSGRRSQWNPPDIPFFEHSNFLRIVSRKLGFTNQAFLDEFVNAPTFIGAGSGSLIYHTNDLMEVMQSNTPLYFRRNLKNMIAIATAHNSQIMFATWAYSPYFDDYASTSFYQQGFEQNNDVVSEVANSHNVLLFDFAKAMPKNRNYWSDGRHVNEDGALLKAQLFAQFIADLNFIQLYKK